MVNTKTWVRFLAVTVFTLAFMTFPAQAQVAETPPQCQVPRLETELEQENESQHANTCDLGVLTSVSVNGGGFLPAANSGEAAAAKIGDTLTWRVQLQNNSNMVIDSSTVLKIALTLPSGLPVGDVNVGAGTYESGVWTLTVADIASELTFITQVEQTGDYALFAAISQWSLKEPDNLQTFSDSDPKNDVSGSYATASASQPSVLAANSDESQVKAAVLAGTGAEIYVSIIASLLIVGSTLAVARSKN